MHHHIDRIATKRLAPSVIAIIVIGVAAIATRTWLVSAQAISAIGTAGHDDRLFILLAEHLSNGQWLGDFDQFTLAKGPFYPIWIALNHQLSVPLLLSQHLLYSAACALLVYALRPLGLGMLTMLALFVLLIFNPASFADGPMTRVVRAGIYPSLTLLVLSGAIGMLLRARGPSAPLGLWGLVLGVSFAAFWLTREEGVWILPTVAMFLLAFLSHARQHTSTRTAVLLVILPLAVATMIVASVAAINFYYYGIFAIVDLKRPAFLEAYGALTRVVGTDWRPDVPVSLEVRRKIYRESPAFRELRPYIDGDAGRNWRTTSYDRSDIGGGWFIWSLRAAAARRGYYESPHAAEAFYRRLGAQVNTACKEGRLACNEPRATLMPPWRSVYTRALFPALAIGTRYLFTMDDLEVFPTLPTGTPEELQLFKNMTNTPLATGRYVETREDHLSVTGWALHTAFPIHLSVRDKEGESAVAETHVFPSPDVVRLAERYGQPADSARNARFSITTKCLDDCVLDISGAHGEQLGLVQLSAPERIIGANGLYFVPDVRPEARAAPRLSYLSEIAHTYQAFLTYVGPLSLAVAVLGCATFWWCKPPAIYCVITAGLWVAVATRILLLSVIHVTSFPALHKLYLAPTYPLYIAAAILTLVLASATVAGRVSGVSFSHPVNKY